MDKRVAKAMPPIISEYIFAFLPMLILVIASAISGDCASIYLTKDWSFVTILLFGQIMIKFNTGMIMLGKSSNLENANLFNSILICILLIPSVLIFCGLCFVKEPPHWLYLAQMIFFVIASFMYFTFGMVAIVLPKLGDSSE